MKQSQYNKMSLDLLNRDNFVHSEVCNIDIHNVVVIDLTMAFSELPQQL